MNFSPPLSTASASASATTSASTSATAYLLIIHGSRDPRPEIAVQFLAQQVEQLLGNRMGAQTLIGVAMLEFASAPLHQQIVDFGDRALKLGHSSLGIVPLFLSPGIHVRQDIPEEVAAAQQQLGDTLSIEILPYVGRDPEMVNLLAQRIVPPMSPSSPVILMAHGSRRPGGNQPIEAIATQLNAIPAYWSVAPTLDDQIQRLIDRERSPTPPHSPQHITVFPYFLFEGGITDAIAQTIEQWNSHYPQTTIALGKPLGPSRDMVELVVNKIMKNTAKSGILEHKH